MEYDNTNRGALFLNKDRTSENQPNAKGKINVGGIEYWINAWTKTSKAGEKYQSLSVTPIEQQQAPVAKPQSAAVSMDFESDVPFSNYEYRTLA